MPVERKCVTDARQGNYRGEFIGTAEVTLGDDLFSFREERERGRGIVQRLCSFGIGKQRKCQQGGFLDVFGITGGGVALCHQRLCGHGLCFAPLPGELQCL